MEIKFFWKSENHNIYNSMNPGEVNSATSIVRINYHRRFGNAVSNAA